MFDNRRYQGVMPRAGRGRYAFARRSIIEINLLVIGALIFVGFGIASLHSNAERTVTLKPMGQKDPQSRTVSGVGQGSVSPGQNFDVTAFPRAHAATLRTAVLEVAFPSQVLTRFTTHIALQRMIEASNRPYGGNGASTGSNTRWIRTPHPLAVPVLLASERATYEFAPTSSDTTAASNDTGVKPAPLVRLETKTGPSPFLYLAVGLSVIAFASGFRNSRKSA